MIEIKQIGKPKGNNGRGSYSGGSASGYIEGIVDEAKHAAKADKATFAEQAQYAEKAGLADRSKFADKAYDLDAESPIFDKFLSKIAADIAEGHITFKQGLTSIAL